MIRRRSAPRRSLATVLFTDIVQSTERASAVGDRAWRELLARHHRIMRRLLKQHHGREVDTAGDGFFATFAQPADAMACATDMADAIERLGIQIRAGIHVGEVEPMADKVGGIAVHITARILAAAKPGEILVSSTVRELAAGSGFTFIDAGTRQLKGVSEEWHVYAIERRPLEAVADAPSEPDERPRRRPLILAAAAIAVLALLSVGAWILTRQTATAAYTGPNRVQQLSAGNDVGAAFRVGGGPSAIAATPSALWVANTDGGTVSRLDRTNGESTVIGSGRPTDLAAVGNQVWVLDPFASTVTLINADTAATVGSLDLHGRAIAASDDAVWVADDINDVVYRIDPRSRQLVATISLPPGSGPSAIAADRDGAWVVNAISGTMSRIDPASNQVVQKALALSVAPSDVAVGGGRVVVASELSDQLIEIDPQSNRVGTRRDVCNAPVALGVTADVTWVACAGDRAVWRIAGENEPVVSTLNGVPAGIVSDGDGAWVTVRES